MPGPPLKAPLHFSGSLSLGHTAPYGIYENASLPSPGVASIIDHSSSCGLLKSITICHASCGMLPASTELSRDTRECPFLGDIGQLWWAPWAWGPPSSLLSTLEVHCSFSSTDQPTCLSSDLHCSLTLSLPHKLLAHFLSEDLPLLYLLHIKSCHLLLRGTGPAQDRCLSLPPSAGSLWEAF